MTLPAPRFLNLAHRHVAEWLTGDDLKKIEDQLVGPLYTARTAEQVEQDDWAELGFTPPAWW